MDFSEIKKKVEIAVAWFMFNDKKLLEFDPGIRLPERPMSHRLGFYLQLLFPDWNVDCEYNRDLDAPKREDGDLVIPDVIIHKRKTRTDNLLVVEVKAENNAREIEEDREIVRKYTRGDGTLRYDYGVFVLLLPDRQSQNWFEAGSAKNV